MRKILFIALPLFLLSCSNQEKTDQEAAIAKQLNQETKAVSVSKEVLNDMVQTLPSPVETANLIKSSNAEFRPEILVPVSAAEQISDPHYQAIALGAYGVDLGYLNLNNKTLHVIEYIDAIRTVAKGLKVDNYFEFSLMNDLAKNRNNLDSLVHISTENFNAIDEHLRAQNRGDLSVLILIGSWLEGLHMLNKISAVKPGSDVAKRIGEQKVLIDNIFAILTKVEDIQFYKDFKATLTPLKDIYYHVEITYTYKEPKMIEKDGQLVVVDNTEANVSISNEQIKNIANEVDQLRNKIFNK